MDNLKVRLVDGTKLHHAEVFFDTQKRERVVTGWNINNKYCSCSAENIAKFEDGDSSIDWEQRRFELIKSLSSGLGTHTANNRSWLVKHILANADAIIEELQKKIIMEILNVKKKPIVIQASHFTEECSKSAKEYDELCKFLGYGPIPKWENGELEGVYLNTLEGKEFAKMGCYIMKGVHGECYPCDEKIFEETYDIV